MAPTLRLPSAAALGRLSLNELIAALKSAHEQLNAVEQDAADRAMLAVPAATLVSPVLLRHKDRTVRRYVSCCLASLLRLFAPEAPFTVAQLQDVFSLFMQQLCGLADERAAYYSLHFFLLESLSTVKSGLLLLDLEEPQAMMMQLFETLLDANVQNDAARLFALELMQSLVEEADALPVELAGLLVRRSRHIGAIIAAPLLKTCADKLQPYLGQYLNEIFLKAAGTAGDGRAHKAASPEGPLKLAHDAIRELMLVAPKAMTAVVPQVEEQLRAEEGDLRLIAMRTLYLVFEHDPSLAKDYPSAYMGWLARRHDKWMTARSTWLSQALRLMALHPSLSESIGSALVDKLQDPEEKMRSKTCESLAALEPKAQLCLPTVLVEEAIVRCRDKSEEVRIKGLEFACNHLNVLESHRSDPQTFAERHASVPNAIFHLMYAEDRHVRLLFEYYIEHSVFILKDASVGRHADRWKTVYRSLDERGKIAFRLWLKNKATFIKYLGAYLQMLEKGIDAKDRRMLPLTQALSQRWRCVADGQRFLQNLPTIFKALPEWQLLLKAIMDPQLPLEVIARHVETCSKDVRLKPYLGEAYCTLHDMMVRAAYLSVHPELIAALLNDGAAPSGLTEELLQEFPQLFRDHGTRLQTLILDSASGEQVAHLAAFERLVKAVSGLALDPTTVERLVDLTRRGPRRAAKHAASILCVADAPMLDSLVRDVAGAVMAGSRDHGEMVLGVQALIAFARCRTERLLGVLPELVDSCVAWIMDHTEIDLASLEDTASRIEQLDPTDSLPPAQQVHPLLLKLLGTLATGARSIDPALGDEYSRQIRDVTLHVLHQAIGHPASPLSARLRVVAAKTLLLLVPRPTLAVLASDLFDMVLLIQDPLYDVRQKVTAEICRAVNAMRIGHVYLALLFFSAHDPSKRLRNQIKKAAAAVVETIVKTETGLADDPVAKLYPVLAILLAKHPDYAGTAEDISLARVYLELALEILASAETVGFLYHAAQELKRYRFVSGRDGASGPGDERLWIMSELAQLVVRTKCAHSKWALESYPAAVEFGDCLLEELSPEAQAENMKRAHLPLSPAHSPKRPRGADPAASRLANKPPPDSPAASLASQSSSAAPSPAKRRNPPRVTKMARGQADPETGGDNGAVDGENLPARANVRDGPKRPTDGPSAKIKSATNPSKPQL